MSGVSGMVGMCWELVNCEWTVWMPARLLQSLSVAERGVSFQDRHFLAIGTSREDNLCNECLRMALSRATVVPHFIWCHILQSYKRYVTIFATTTNENGIGHSPDQFFPCGEKWSGNETRKYPYFGLWLLVGVICCHWGSVSTQIQVAHTKCFRSISVFWGK